jgi:chromosome segregation ATPase
MRTSVLEVAAGQATLVQAGLEEAGQYQEHSSKAALELEHFTVDLKAKEEKLDELQRTLNLKEAEASESANAVNRLEAQVVHLKADLANIDEMHSAIEIDAIADKAMLTERNQQLEEAGRRFLDANKMYVEQQELTGDLLAAEKITVAELEGMLENFTAASNMATDSNARLEVRAAELEAEVSQLAEERVRLAAELNAAKDEVMALEILARRQAAMAKVIDQTSDTKTQLEDQLSNLGQQLADKENEFVTAREEASAKENAFESALAHTDSKLTAALITSATEAKNRAALDERILEFKIEVQRAAAKAAQVDIAASEQHAQVEEDIAARDASLNELRKELAATNDTMAAGRIREREAEEYLLEAKLKLLASESSSAEEKMQLGDQIAELDRQLAASEATSAKGSREKAVLEEKLEKLATEVQKAKSILAQSEGATSRAHAQAEKVIAALNTALKEKNKELAAADDMATNAKKRADDSEEAQRAARRDQGEAGSNYFYERSLLSDQIAELETRLAVAEAKPDLTSALSEGHGEIAKLQKALDLNMSEVVKMEIELQHVTEIVASDKRGQAEENFATLDTLLDKKCKELAAAHEEVASEKSYAEKLEAALLEAKRILVVVESSSAKKKAALNERIAELETRLAAMDESIAEGKKENAVLEEKGTELEVELQQAKATLVQATSELHDQAEENITGLNASLDKVRKELAAANDKVAGKTRAEELEAVVSTASLELAAAEISAVNEKKALRDEIIDLEVRLAAAEAKPDLSEVLSESQEEVARVQNALDLKVAEIASALALASRVFNDRAHASSSCLEQTFMIEPIMDPLSSSKPRDPPRYFHRALFDFEAMDPTQLTLREGDELTILSADTDVEGWVEARNAQGNIGLMPSTYLQLSSVGAVVISGDADEGDEDEMTTVLLPSGVIVGDDNSLQYPDGSSRQADGTVRLRNGRMLSTVEYTASKAGKDVLMDGCVMLANGCFEYPSGTASMRNGKMVLPDGTFIESPWQLLPPQPDLTSISNASRTKERFWSAAEASLESAVSRLADEHARLVIELDGKKAEVVALELLARRQAVSTKTLDESSDTKKQLEDQLSNLEQQLADKEGELETAHEEAAAKANAFTSALARKDSKCAKEEEEKSALEVKVVELEKKVEQVRLQLLTAASALDNALEEKSMELAIAEATITAGKSQTEKLEASLSEASRKYSAAESTSADEKLILYDQITTLETQLAAAEMKPDLSPQEVARLDLAPAFENDEMMYAIPSSTMVDTCNSSSTTLEPIGKIEGKTDVMDPDLLVDLAFAKDEIASLQRQFAAASANAANSGGADAEEVHNLKNKLATEKAHGEELMLKMMDMVSAAAEVGDLRKEKEAQQRELDGFKRRNSLLINQLESSRLPSKVSFFGKNKANAEKDAMEEELALLRASENTLRQQKEIDDSQLEVLQATVDELKKRLDGGNEMLAAAVSKLLVADTQEVDLSEKLENYQKRIAELESMLKKKELLKVLADVEDQVASPAKVFSGGFGGDAAGEPLAKSASVIAVPDASGPMFIEALSVVSAHSEQADILTSKMRAHKLSSGDFEDDLCPLSALSPTSIDEIGSDRLENLQRQLDELTVTLGSQTPDLSVTKTALRAQLEREEQLKAALRDLGDTVDAQKEAAAEDAAAREKLEQQLTAARCRLLEDEEQVASSSNIARGAGDSRHVSDSDTENRATFVSELGLAQEQLDDLATKLGTKTQELEVIKQALEKRIKQNEYTSGVLKGVISKLDKRNEFSSVDAEGAANDGEDLLAQVESVKDVVEAMESEVFEARHQVATLEEQLATSAMLAEKADVLAHAEAEEACDRAVNFAEEYARLTKELEAANSMVMAFEQLAKRQSVLAQINSKKAPELSEEVSDSIVLKEKVNDLEMLLVVKATALDEARRKLQATPDLSSELSVAKDKITSLEQQLAASFLNTADGAGDVGLVQNAEGRATDLMLADDEVEQIVDKPGLSESTQMDLASKLPERLDSPAAMVSGADEEVAALRVLLMAEGLKKDLLQENLVAAELRIEQLVQEVKPISRLQAPATTSIPKKKKKKSFFSKGLFGGRNKSDDEDEDTLADSYVPYQLSPCAPLEAQSGGPESKTESTPSKASLSFAPADPTTEQSRTLQDEVRALTLQVASLHKELQETSAREKTESWLQQEPGVASGPSDPAESIKGVRQALQVELVEADSKDHDQKSLESQKLSRPQPLHYFYKALFEFEARDTSQLTLACDEEVQVLSMETGMDGWWLAKNAESMEGLIPSNYVQLSCDGAVDVGGDDEGDDDEIDLLLPSGVIIRDDNSIRFPDGSLRQADGSVRLPDGRTLSVNEHALSKMGKELLQDGCILLESGCFEYPSGVVSTRDGTLLSQDGKVSESPWQLPPPQVDMTVATPGAEPGELRNRGVELQLMPPMAKSTSVTVSDTTEPMLTETNDEVDIANNGELKDDFAQNLSCLDYISADNALEESKVAHDVVDFPKDVKAAREADQEQTVASLQKELKDAVETAEREKVAAELVEQESIKLKLLKEREKLKALFDVAELTAAEDRAALVQDYEAKIAALEQQLVALLESNDAMPVSRTNARETLDRAALVKEHNTQIEILKQHFETGNDQATATILGLQQALEDAARAADHKKAAAEVAIKELLYSGSIESSERLKEIQEMLEDTQLAAIKDRMTLVQEHEAKVADLQKQLSTEELEGTKTICRLKNEIESLKKELEEAVADKIEVATMMEDEVLRGQAATALARQMRGKDLDYHHIALFSFEGTKALESEDAQVTFAANARIEVLDMDTGREGWWLVKTKDGSVGLVPSNYLQLSCAGAVGIGADDDGDEEMMLVSGCIVEGDYHVTYPDGSHRRRDDTVLLADGSVCARTDEHGGIWLPDGSVLLDSGCFRYPSGMESTRDGKLRARDGTDLAAPWELPPAQPFMEWAVSKSNEELEETVLMLAQSSKEEHSARLAAEKRLGVIRQGNVTETLAVPVLQETRSTSPRALDEILEGLQRSVSIDMVPAERIADITPATILPETVESPSELEQRFAALKNIDITETDNRRLSLKIGAKDLNFPNSDKTRPSLPEGLRLQLRLKKFEAENSEVVEKVSELQATLSLLRRKWGKPEPVLSPDNINRRSMTSMASMTALEEIQELQVTLQSFDAELDEIELTSPRRSRGVSFALDVSSDEKEMYEENLRIANGSLNALVTKNDTLKKQKEKLREALAEANQTSSKYEVAKNDVVVRYRAVKDDKADLQATNSMLETKLAEAYYIAGEELQKALADNNELRKELTALENEKEVLAVSLADSKKAAASLEAIEDADAFAHHRSLKMRVAAFGYHHVALFDFEAEAPKQLSFFEGDKLNVIEFQTGWWRACDGQGREGLVPRNYLQLSCAGAVEIGDPEEEESFALLLASGCVAQGDNTMVYPDGASRAVDEETTLEDGSVCAGTNDDGGMRLPDGSVLLHSGCFRYPSGAESTRDGKLRRMDGIVVAAPWSLPSQP